MNDQHIPEGCILLARKLQDSDIWGKPSDWLKVWIYFLQGVNHGSHKQFKRGENFFNIVEMAKDCGVSRHTIYHFIKWAKSATLITTRKTTRGVVLTVLNYDKYQTLGNYSNDTNNDTSGETETKQKRYRNDTINKYVKNDKNEKEIQYMFSEYERMSGRKVINRGKKVVDSLQRIRKIYTDDQILSAWAAISVKPFMRGQNESNKDYFTIEYACRPNKVEDYIHEYERLDTQEQS